MCLITSSSSESKQLIAADMASLEASLIPEIMIFQTSREADLNTALHRALARGNLALVKQLIHNGADVNSKSFLYETALYAASRGGQLAMVDLLLQNGADVNAQSGPKGGYLAVAQLLLQNGADVNAQGGRYGSALHAALAESHLAVACLLLQNGADVRAQGVFYGGSHGQAYRSTSNYRPVRRYSSARREQISRIREQQATFFKEERAMFLARFEEERERERVVRHEKDMAISSAALQDDWETVRRLVAEGYDPNYGKSFMERPLAVAIVHANLEEAEFLLRNYAIRDLGDQFYPLRDAILRKNIQEAQAILSRPRSLKPPKVETKQQTLQRHFHETHKIFLIGSQSTGADHEYKMLAAEMDSHKRMWRTGMTGVRRLIKNRPPRNLQQVIGILCIATAMRKSIQSEDTFGNHDLFLEDLDRWRELAIRPKQRMLFDEIAFAIWGKRLNSTGTPDTLAVQEEDRYILFEAIRKMVQRFTTESSLPLAQLEHENFWEHYESSRKTSVVLYESRGPHNNNCESPNDPRIGSLPDLSAAQDHPYVDDLAEGWDGDPGPKSLVPALLMMGAIFACVIHFLFALHSGRVFLASSQTLSTQLDASYGEFLSQILAASPAAEIVSDLRSATTSTLITMEGLALVDRYELMQSFLSHTDGWVPLEPASSMDGSVDPFSFDSESNSLSATAPTPSTLSGSSTSTTSKHRCRICDRVFSSTGNLNRHLKRHQNSRKHSCQNAQLGCRYSDIRKDNVEKHEMKHCRWKNHV